MVVYTYNEYSAPGFVDSIMKQKLDVGMCRVVVYPNTQIEMPVRVFLLNVIFWEPIMKFGIVPTIKEVHRFKYMTNTAISKIHTHLYELFLNQRPNDNHMDFVMELFNNIGRLYNFVKLYCGSHMPSIDDLGLVRLMENPALKKLGDTVFDPKLGTKNAEAQMKQISKELITLLGDPTIDNNVLYPYMKAGVLKSNQIPQMLVAYGTRSDIDDTTRKHIISNSTFSGLASIKDFATEYLSAKKATYANSTSIKKSQYNGRKMKLTLSSLAKLYPGTCGSTRTLDYRIPSEYKFNFMEKIVIDNGTPVILTPDNINDYVDKPIHMVSPFCCNYTDGVCERCAGFGRGRLLKYMPPNIHIGLLSASILASIISQKILSTKHLTSNFSILYSLPQDATNLLFVSEDSIFWKEHLRNTLKKLTVRIPMDAISMAEDIQLDVLPIAENFSKLAYIELLSGGVVKQHVNLGEGRMLPYLSEHTLKYIKDYPDCLDITSDYVDIKLEHFQIKQPFCKYIVLNDDMLAYHTRVSGFMSTSIRNHTTVAGALNEFSSTVFDKSNIDFFYLEMVLRAFNMTTPEDYTIPVIEDMNATYFGGMSHIITNRTLSMKLSFERLGDYLTVPSSVLRIKPAGMYAPFYGIV